MTPCPDSVKVPSMHFCHEEVLGLLAGLPFLRLLVIRIRNWFHRRWL